ncbi:hypothetical protein ACFQ14_12450 [Pseudahrensia aquimaris]|uniref:Na+/proline symporter n=1 Tax=Pseudahrensia aquimaris TaxID=744461 RepID=A0ABW3FFH5_9HYPH
MSSLNLKDAKAHPLDNDQISTALWIAAASFISGLVILALLGRLGLPVFLTYAGALLLFNIAIAVLAWRGRTMTGRSFFFADKMGSSATTGFGGGADFAGGAVLLVFASLTTQGQALWLMAVFLGMTLMSVFFAHSLYRETVSTVTGYFAIRYPGQGAGMASVPVVLAMLLLLAIAEFGVSLAVLERLAVDNSNTGGWMILGLAVLPALVGGWFSILLVNAVLALWTVICVLIPTFFIALLPGVLSSDDASLIAGSELTPLPPLTGLSFQDSGGWAAYLSVCVLAAGFSVLPQSFSRMATVKRPAATMEHIGWAALFVFVVVAVSGLSIALIMEGADEQRAGLLSNNPMLHVLPYLALLFIAFNALSTTILAFSSAAVRSFRRSRREDPGERSMFGTRLLCVLVAVGIGLSLNGTSVPIWEALRSALLLGAGGLFVPLLATTQTRRLPAWAVGLSILIGTSVTAYGMIAPYVNSLPVLISSPYISAMVSIVLSALIVLAGHGSVRMGNSRATAQSA